jgi:hypothetical protein
MRARKRRGGSGTRQTRNNQENVPGTRERQSAKLFVDGEGGFLSKSFISVLPHLRKKRKKRMKERKKTSTKKEIMKKGVVF